MAEANPSEGPSSNGSEAVERRAAAAGRRRHVVVAIDESKESMCALDWALANVVRETDRVHVLHAQPPPPLNLYSAALSPGSSYLGAASLMAPPSLVEGLKKQADHKSKQLLMTAKDKCRAYRVAAEGDVIVGEAREAICSAVEQLQADMLVLGSHGYGAVQRAVLGSVSDHCVHHARCPVIVVRTTTP